MLKIPFNKYQGTGNDFVIIDNRTETYLDRSMQAAIQQICDRKFGIGADGLILLQNKPGFDFEMVYFNADGNESSMCGNGGRCIVAFARQLGVIKEEAYFLAIDGPHQAKVTSEGWVELKMSDVASIERGDDFTILDTGSPHYIVFVEDLKDINIVQSGQQIRYSDRFKTDGINVNFVEKTEAGIAVGTYERGVEDETLSCGTGVTAAAIALVADQQNSNDIPASNEVAISTKGGQLKVRLTSKEQHYTDIWLCGPATKVFEGTYPVRKD